ncbi:hypothetical protein PHYBOEH_005672 [Phytophthora boehmeriae]|uniref:Bromo domain-containing protein n=1 Tax=Phytophthora boehmeriae TaxID=109152 RepID=A0A8T1XEP5_9STRA|nr:hypothetical protein PHYBOEH_005672 [Phytophthora boehmeriae]
MSVEMSAKYMADSSSSSSLSSDSDDVSSSSSSSIMSSSSASESDSDTPRATPKKKKTGTRGRSAKKVDVQMSNSEADSDLDSATSGGKKKKKKLNKPPAPRRSPPKKSNGKATQAAITPPSLPPPPPPPPSPPPPVMPDGDSSSNSSFPSSSDSSSSDSSDLSDSETLQSAVPAAPPLPPRANATGGAAKNPVAAKATKRRATTRKKVTDSNPSSLKVTLKLPPGFIANTGNGAVSMPANSGQKLKFQVTDPAATGISTNNDIKRAKVGDDDIFQGDGEASQMDGISESESGGSNLTSDDEDIRSGRSGSIPGSDDGRDSEILSSSAWFLVKNYPFIRTQISDLFPDKETYLESMFFKQLHRLHENYTLREARHQKEMAEREVRRAKRENDLLRRRQRAEHERQRIKDEREEERKQKEQEQRYPIEDLALLEGEAVGTNSLPLLCSNLKGIEGPLLGEIIMAWQTISTFKDFVGLESISLEALVECITAQCDEGTDIGLARIFIALLRVILAEKSFLSLMDDLAVEGNTKVSDLFINSERTYGMCERASGDMLNAVTWQEILRQFMAKDLGIDPSIGHVEPLVGCEIVRQTLYMQANSGPFNSPVDTTLKGLEDYLQVVRNPMDLGTIKKTLETGGYEGPGGYEKFAADIRLVWDNAVLYNGEESEVGRAALALSDVFEQDYERFVAGRVRANENRIEGCKKAKEVLKESSSDKPCQYSDVVYGLYCTEFHELPTSYKIGALSWICSEFLTLSSIRTYLASQVDQEMLIHRNHRKRAADLDTRRKHSDRVRRERENAFRKDCISQGIHPNSHNVFSEGIKRKHEFIPKFFEDMQAEKIADDNAVEQERKVQLEEVQNELNSIVIRESPLGKDRYHNSYYMFKHDSKPRLFIERGDSGDFTLCSNKAQLMEILEWLNPKGIRELDLLTRLEEIKDKLLSSFDEDGGKQDGEATTEIIWNTKGGMELQMFPLPGGAIKGDTMIITDADKIIKSYDVARQMLLCLKKHLEDTNTLPASWEGSQTWCSRVEKASSFQDQLDLFAELESAAATALSSGAETIRPSWQRKRHEWRLALEGSCTYAQLVFLLHVLLEEFINVEAFMDLHIRLDRREWLKLRPKETRNFIPEAGKVVIYFGDGHALALKEDEKSKRKRFTQKSDQPVHNATMVCTVEKVSYHHGGGDPYALAVLNPIADMAQHDCVRKPGSLLCTLPSREQRLARVFLRILAKLKLLADAGPFLEPVSDREFPQYKEIILHPMDLGRITDKASKLEYKSGTEFMADLRLMRDNCQLFCEGRFPTLPPLAHNLVSVADSLMKKWGKEIRACEDSPIVLSENEQSGTKEDKEEDKPFTTTLPSRPIVTILRLENRLPEYIVDISRYLWAVNRTWRCGEKFRMLFRNPQGQPGEYYGGVTAGSLPFDEHGMLPWEALRVTWDEDDGSDDNRINPWEAEIPRSGNRA